MQIDLSEILCSVSAKQGNNFQVNIQSIFSMVKHPILLFILRMLPTIGATYSPDRECINKSDSRVMSLEAFY